MTDKPKVELRSAYSWDCDACGEENFERGGVPDLIGEDLQFLRENEGIEAWEVGQFVMVPQNVECKRCGEKFASIFPEVDTNA